MCDEFVCSDSGVGLCEADRKLLERLGSRNPRTKGDTKGDGDHGGDTDNNNNEEEANRNFDKDRGSHLFGDCSSCSVSRSWWCKVLSCK